MPKIRMAYSAPSAWANYLINSDPSGMSAEDMVACKAWLAEIGLGWPVDCNDEGFVWCHDAWAHLPYGADCQTYVFLK